MDTKSRPSGANSYKLNLFITDTQGTSLRCSRPTHSSKPFVYRRFRASATQAIKGPGVDNLRYVPFPVGCYTNIDTLSVSDTNTRTCRYVSFQNLHLLSSLVANIVIENTVAIANSIRSLYSIQYC